MKTLGRSALAIVLLMAGCSSKGPTAPAESTPLPTLPSAPQATTPPETPGAAATNCPLGFGTYNPPCGREGPLLLADVESAIVHVIAARPALFDLTSEAGPGRYRVLDQDAVERGVAATMAERGFCTQLGAGLEIKNSNSFSESYKIVESSGYLWRGEDLYRRTCTPAAFPVDASKAIARIRIAFYEMTCGDRPTERPLSFTAIRAGCRGTLTASPKDRADEDVPASIHGPDIVWDVDGADANIARVADYPDVPFNKIVYGRAPGGFSVCATVQGVRGCMNGQVQ